MPDSTPQGIDPSNIDSQAPATSETNVTDAPPQTESEPPLTFEQKALKEVHSLVERDNERAAVRYKGVFNNKFLSRVNQWFNRAGERKIADTIEETALYRETSKWHKWAGIGLKIAGGVGAATAMVTTGGAAALTPIIYSEGIRNAFDGVLQVVEELSMGKGRSEAENGAQCVLTSAILAFQEAVGRENLTEEEYASAVAVLQGYEADLIKQQLENTNSEKRWNFGRKVVSGIATIATTVFNGIPLGREGGEVATKVGETALDQGHRTFWDLASGKTFTYNDAQEATRVASEATKHHYFWSTIHNVFGQTAHTMGQGLSVDNIASLRVARLLIAANIGWAALKWPGKERVATNSAEEPENTQPEVTPPQTASPENNLPEVPANTTKNTIDVPVTIVSTGPQEAVQTGAPVNGVAPESNAVDTNPVVEPAVVPIVAPPVVFDSPESTEPTGDQSSAQDALAPAVTPVVEAAPTPEVAKTPVERLNLIRTQLKEHKSSWDIKRHQLRKEYEKIAIEFFNSILIDHGGLMPDGKASEHVRDEFCYLTGLDASQIKMYPDKKNKKQVTIKFKWDLIK